MKWGDAIVDKVKDRKGVREWVHVWRKFGDQIVFTNGCFDILHRGHLDYLSKAADLGDRLIIGVNTDQSVRNLKGSNRPVIDQETRALKLASLAYVDAVVLFDEETPLDLITALEPDILVKGADYSESEVVGAKEVQTRGGRVVLIPFLEGFSTSAIIERFRKD